MKTSELYEKTTQRIIAELKEGVPPWTRPWKDDHVRGVGMIPSNLATGRLYSGSNILLLWMSAHARGYDNLQFCTFKQAQEMEAKVKKGEKATPIIFTKHVLKKDESTGQDKAATVVKTYSVFHLSQLENVPSKYLQPQTVENRALVHERAIEFVKGTGVRIEQGANKAAYYPVNDHISMPRPSLFESEDAYWGTLNHELTHASGHPDRLDRKFGKRFGDRQYAAEELIAELGSAFLCARLGIAPTFRSASYIDNWLRILGDDSRAVFSAASYAGHASDWLWSKSFGEEQEKDVAVLEPSNEQEEDLEVSY